MDRQIGYKSVPMGRQVLGEPGPWSEELAARQVAIHLAGDIALEDADDLAFGTAFLHSALHVGPVSYTHLDVYKRQA